MSKILVLGTGAWATALSQVLLTNKHDVIMYGINDQEINDLKNQINTKYFGKDKLLNAYSRFEKSLDFLKEEKVDYILFVVPSDATLKVLKEVDQKINNDFYMINAAKGFVNEKMDVFSNLIKAEHFNHIKNFSVLLGPGFSMEVTKQYFTVVNVISEQMEVAQHIADLFTCSYFVAKPGTNIVGSEILACMKNPLAIVVGLLTGLGLSVDTIVAFVTLGIQEIKQLLKAYKVNDDVIYSYCGFGDIYLTTSNSKSRNYSFGLLLAQYKTFSQALEHNTKTVEGINATKVAINLFNKFGIKTNLFQKLYLLINNDISAREFVDLVISCF